MIRDIKKRSLHRAKIIQGQTAALIRQIENEEYCVDILTQSLAIQRSLGSLNKLLLENHLNTHVVEAITEHPETIPKQIDDLLMLYELNNIRGKS